tara:strand:+ start:327 stop:533 length:207 start_codon:yes stop_codon:yes gene_type:complete
MWKVIIVVCTLGNPCVVMQEDPIRFYDNKSECMANGSVKHSRILESFSTYGYQIEKSDFTCEKVDNII